MRMRSVSKVAAVKQDAAAQIWPAMFSLCFFASVLIVMLRYGLDA